LVIFTPNANSLGHQLFGSSWRGLEPPRHLHIFTPGSMRRILTEAGLPNCSIQTVAAPQVLFESEAIRTANQSGRAASANRDWRKYPHWQFIGLISRIIHTTLPQSGEILRATAWK
jgi:hypothetical protein